MLHITELTKTRYRQLKAYLRRQAQTGEYWQPRCYRGDPNWQPRRWREREHETVR